MINGPSQNNRSKKRYRSQTSPADAVEPSSEQLATWSARNANTDQSPASNDEVLDLFSDLGSPVSQSSSKSANNSTNEKKANVTKTNASTNTNTNTNTNNNNNVDDIFGLFTVNEPNKTTSNTKNTNNEKPNAPKQTRTNTFDAFDMDFKELDTKKNGN